mgnify:CR=1 FL=1
MRCSRRSREQWGSLDFLVHAIAFSDKNELKGRYADTTRENFIRTMLISCFSFTEVAKRAAALMPAGGAMVTLTYNGGQRAMPNYNVMGVAKAALEASVRYLAVDFGPSAIRVNAISAGPIRTLAGAGIARRAADVRLPAAPFAAAARRDARRDRRRRGSICSPTSRAASPATSISSIPATTSSPCRSRARCKTATRPATAAAPPRMRRSSLPRDAPARHLDPQIVADGSATGFIAFAIIAAIWINYRLELSRRGAAAEPPGGGRRTSKPAQD